MEAGRELDAWIAKHVMGWTEVGRSNWDTRDYPVAEHEFVGFSPSNFDKVKRHLVPHYSAEIELCYQMEQKIADGDLKYEYVTALLRIVDPDASMFISILETDTWNGVMFETLFGLIHATPEQRCLAALETIKEKHNE